MLDTNSQLFKFIRERGMGRKPTYEELELRIKEFEDKTIKDKRIEKEKERLEAQLASSMELAHLGYWEYDVANDLFTFNDHFYKIYRTSAEQVGGYTMSSAEYARRFVHPDDIPAFLKKNQETKEAAGLNPGRNAGEHRILYTDGTVGYISVRFLIVQDAHLQTMKIYGVNQDITEQKLSEEALRESEERFKFLTEEMADIVWTMDQNFRTTYVSPSIEKLLGFMQEERKKQSLAEMVTPESMRAVQMLFQKELEIDRQGTGDPDRSVTVEVEYYHKNGSTVWMENKVKAIRDSSGMLIGMYGVARDIMDRKQAEEALRKNEIKYRSIFDNSMDAILLTDPNGPILDANPAACRMFGRTVEEIIEIGRNGLVDITDPRLQKALKERERSGQTHAEIIMVRADQTKFPAIISSTVFTDQDGQKKTSMIIRDITDQKKEEEHIRRRTKITAAVNRVLEGALRAGSDVEVAGICLSEAEKLSGSRFGWIGEINSSGRLDTIALSDPGWDVCTMTGRQAAAIKDMEIRGIFGRVLKDGKSMFTNEPAAHPDRVGVPDGHPELTSFLGVPLKQAGRTIGMLALANKDSGYTWSDQDAMESLSMVFLEALQRNRAEGAIRAGELKYKNIFENIQDVYHEVSMDGIIQEVSPSIEIELGYTREDLIGRSIKDFCFNNDEREHFVKKLIKNRRIRDYEMRFRHKDQSVVFCSLNGSIKTDADGRPVMIICSLHNINRFKEAEVSLRVAEEKYRSIVENAAEGIFQTTREGHFLTVNKAMSDMLGYDSPGELITTITDIKNQLYVNPQDRNIIDKQSKETLKVKSFETRFFKKDGRYIWALVNRRDVYDKDGKFLYYEGICQDITDRIEAKERLESTLRQLQETKEMLIQSEKLAAIGKLSAGVAHEVLNPVNIISIRMQLMERTENLSDKVKESIKICNAQIKRIIKITNDLKQFSRVSLKNLGHYNVNDIIEYTLSVTAPRLKMENVKVEKRLQYSLPEILLDKYRIEQVALNLINNALDAMINIGRKKILRITTKMSTFEERRMVLVTISDNGSGIEEKDLVRIFDPFFTTNKHGEGTGLGLSICYGIIRDHGGKIWAENNPEGGANFCFELPIE